MLIFFLYQFMHGCTIDVDMAYGAMRPLLSVLGDYRGLNLSIIKRLSSLVQLFPTSFNEKLCESMQVNIISINEMNFYIVLIVTV